MQASSSGLVKVDEAPKRKKPPPNKGQGKSKKKCFWTGVGGLDDLDSSEDDDDASESGNSPSTSASGSGVPDCPVKGATSAHTSASQSRAEHTATSEAPSASSNSISGPSSPESPAEVQTRSQAEAAASGGSGEQKEVVPTEETFPKTNNLGVAQSSVNQAACEDAPLDLQAVHSDKELETLGLDRLKAELIARGMKCGGTLSERAARLFSTIGLSAEDIDPALLAKPSKGKKQ
eukprot:XP_013987041.1 PREDICTED: protein SDE2 homolog [Salmo salar]